MEETLIFAIAKKNEFSIALGLYQQAGKRLSQMNLSQWDYWSDPPADKLAWVRQGVENGEFVFVYNQTNDLVGMFRLMNSDTLYWEQKGIDKGVRYVHSLVIADPYTGSGLGQEIMKRIITNLKSKEIKLLRLDCEASNSKLCAYYEAFGFQKTGEKTTPYSTNNLYELSLCP